MKTPYYHRKINKQCDLLRHLNNIGIEYDKTARPISIELIQSLKSCLTFKFS